MKTLSQVRMLLVAVAAIMLNSCSQAEPAPGPPSTVAQAAANLDLAKLPLYAGAIPPGPRQLASVNYEVQAEVEPVLEFHRRQLLERGWKEVGTTSQIADAASATFARGGYTLALSVGRTGPDRMLVSLTQLGNVPMGSLPVPDGATSLYVDRANALYVTSAPVAETAAACRKRLIDAGWQPYGSAGDSQFFKQNAIRLVATVSNAPAQGGKTMISYNGALMSADLPAPADAEDLQYADTTSELSFITSAEAAKVFDFYRTALTAAGWQATTENPVDLDQKQVLIFRNPAKDYLEVEANLAREPLAIRVRYQSAAEFEAMEKRMREAAAKKVSATPGANGDH